MTDDDDTGKVLRALADPRRRAILRLVRDDELPAGEIADAFDVTRPAVSQHLTVLKEAGLVSERRDGARRMYRSEPAGLEALHSFLDELWGGALARARRLVEDEQVPQGLGREVG